MNDLLVMSMPWWHFVVRGALSYAALLVLLRLTGKRTFSDMSPFDIVVLVIVGGALRSAMIGSDSSLPGPLLAVATILVLDKLLAHVAARSERLNRILEGTPLLLVTGGKLIAEALRKAGIARAGFDRELRLHGIRSLHEVQEMRLEPNGKVSVLKAR
jgi:uncharacterized membrane protein YcaP (DUF421 family)